MKLRRKLCLHEHKFMNADVYSVKLHITSRLVSKTKEDQNTQNRTFTVRLS